MNPAAAALYARGQQSLQDYVTMRGVPAPVALSPAQVRAAAGRYAQGQQKGFAAADAAGVGPATPVAQTDVLAQTLTGTTETLVLGQKMTQGRFWAPYRWFIFGCMMFALVYVLLKTKWGYGAVYYAQVLILLFLFATQATFLRASLYPLLGKSPSGNTNTSPTAAPFSLNTTGTVASTTANL